MAGRASAGTSSRRFFTAPISATALRLRRTSPKDLQPEAKLLVQLSRSRGRSRIHFNLKVLREGFTVNRKFYW